MKKISITSILVASALMLSAPALSAQNHRNQGVANNRTSTQSSSQSRPSGNSTVRPGGNMNSRPSGSLTRPNASTVRPGGNSTNHTPGNSVRPGGNNNNKPNTSVRPGGNNNNHNPGNNPGHGNHPGHGNNWGGNHGWSHSAPRPGVGATPSPRPNYNYRPPRINRWERPLPPPPPRYSYRPVYAVPSISNVLGITFGTLMDFGVRTLLNAGYNIAGYYDNAIYLNNVSQFGIVWPQATIYYGNSGMSGARFQNASYSPNQSTFLSAFNSLCAAYGSPVNTETVNGVTTYTWWGGNNTGYITLQYGPGLTQNGSYQYYTDLIIGNGY